MPRSGEDQPKSDNAMPTEHNIIHGSGPAESTRVSRADKTAPMPEHSHGAGIKKEDLENMPKGMGREGGMRKKSM
ncbi:hypothetical protein VTJ04DRAFT_7404 [Mycothermus thermophilus]|uniref:uncharacterized protein n=1 Tax=Humicola insolens TaxID=85995 RepID=UPI003744AC0B